MADGSPLPPAVALANRNTAHFPNESPEYRAARNALLAEELELRRHIERVAVQRRALPPGGEVNGGYSFEGEAGPADFGDLFGEKNTLVLYSWMFGPRRERPCPMCTTMLDSWDGQVGDILQNVALAVVGRSPFAKLNAFKAERGWRFLPIYSDLNDSFSRDYRAIAPDGDDLPGFNVFTRRDGTIRHFWSGEFSGEMADPGQDPRSAPELAPLWTILDATPGGRAPDWYPKLSY